MTSQTNRIPYHIRHDGWDYWSTGKQGKRIDSNVPVQEMEAADSHRIWIDMAGKVYAD